MGMTKANKGGAEKAPKAAQKAGPESKTKSAAKADGAKKPQGKKEG